MTSAEGDAGRIDALRIESDGGVLILATRHDGQIEARTSSDRIVLDREAVVRLADWLTKHDPHAERDAGWSCCGHADYYHGPEVPGCVECRCTRVLLPVGGESDA